MNADDKALRAALRAEFRRLYAARDALKRDNRVVPIEAGHFMRHRGPGNYEAAVRQQNEKRQIKAIPDATTASRWACLVMLQLDAAARHAGMPFSAADIVAHLGLLCGAQKRE